ncbi:galactokinase [Jiangella alkaliphila]|uniref:Galactokinase n=1 Tax=Jiangella alkaliphila TaxID=419479 RepID=A0A1H2IZZ9_9ACTN|nr:galactokinase [Jiangella alkaliphila]SDU49709.1 galactokinase [Jiangella alkaliphila]
MDVHAAVSERTGSAPGRVNLIGEHTDYNGGFALPLAIPDRTTARVRTRDDGVVTAASTAPGTEPASFAVDSSPGDVTGWAAYVAGVFWALRDAGHDVPGAFVSIESDVPTGAGLSSSHALECAVAVTLNDLHGLGLDRTTLALLVQRAENRYVGAPTGAMDQMASLYGQDGHVILFDARAMTAQPVPCDLAAAGLSLVVVDTRVHHEHVDGGYGARRATCEAAAALLGVETLREVQDSPADEVLGQLDDDIMVRRVRHVLTENARVLDTVALLRAGRAADIGPLLTASHASMRDDYEITVAEVDTAVDAALAAGALGARMTGGGFGGSVIALTAAADAARVGDAVRAAFDQHGYVSPSVFTVRPAAGAGIEESQ